MNETLFINCNKKVKKNDTVYIIGDFAWKKSDAEQIIGKLSGQKILIIGNHDTWISDENIKSQFLKVVKYEEVSLFEHQLTMCHYPMLEWKNSRKEGTSRLGYLIFGHIHNNIEPLYSVLFKMPNALNAGIDVNNYEPVTFDELVKNNEQFSKMALEKLEEN